MKKLLVINPNSSVAMTKEIEISIADCELQGFSADVIRMPESPEVLESYADYTRAGYQMLRYLDRNEKYVGTFDGLLLACFGDPCLYALKERLDVPVIGIAEASMSLALLLGYRFGIVAAVPKAAEMMRQLADGYGLSGRLACVESLDLTITEFMNDAGKLAEAFEKCASAASAKGADTVIYGCAGMTMLQRLDVQCEPGVIDPVKAGFCQLAALAGGGFGISGGGLFR